MGFPYASYTAAVTGVTTAAYAANQIIGALNSFSNVPQGGFLQGVQINLNSTNASQIDLCTFTSSMPNTTFTNASSIAVSSADFANQGPVVSVTAWNYMGTNASNGLAAGLGVQYPNQLNSTLFWCLVARGAVTVNSSQGVSVTATFAS